MQSIPLVRRAVLSDVDDLYKLGMDEDGFEVAPGSRFYSRTTLRDWIENPLDDILLVAEFDRRVVGLLFCKVRSRRWASLENIAVDPRWRQSGLGARLLNDCIDLLDGLDCPGIHGIVRHGNPALSFFKSHGFSLGHDFTWIERRRE